MKNEELEGVVRFIDSSFGIMNEMKKTGNVEGQSYFISAMCNCLSFDCNTHLKELNTQEVYSNQNQTFYYSPKNKVSQIEIDEDIKILKEGYKVIFQKLI